MGCGLLECVPFFLPPLDELTIGDLDDVDGGRLEHDRADGLRPDRDALGRGFLDSLSELTKRETLSILRYVGTGEDDTFHSASRRAVFGRVAPPRSSVACTFCRRTLTIAY